ncbi:MAG: type II secretion system protein [Candidatus Omnitrophica bacterium]|nr:type II secretion system protein [Candidatus Omnitrophota bacterium]MDE2230755.1 type II secretion system protein [Candidatus Omnitrophota bacterium]
MSFKQLIRKTGFSLLEMTLVMIIITIIASAVIPQLINQYTTNAANKTALDISAIEEASRAYYIANNQQWPQPNDTYPTAIAVLQAGGYLPPTWNPINPFGYGSSGQSNFKYFVSSSGPLLTVSTNVPIAATSIIQNLLPTTSVSGSTITSSVSISSFSGSGFGSWQTLSFNTVYQAATDGYLVGSVDLWGGLSGVQYGQAYFYTSQTSPPSINPEAAIQIYLYQAPGQTNSAVIPFNFEVRKGDYYELALTGGNVTGQTLKFLPS